ncbi:L-2-hydroxyglutarate oxidase [Parapusillimonas sp. SGNA-6]|nr:L-2-hydroxyglutarate oxidase [Parapusillimonas sp. SGNA-6]
MLDYCVVGGGIVGLATALELLERHPNAAIVLLEKEGDIATQQTGHNSGVIHAGIYYRANSLKAQLCRAGEKATKAFCRANNIPFQQIGKLVVATNRKEEEGMHDLKANAALNGIDTQVLNRCELSRLEPNIAGVAALQVPTSGIVDYKAVTKAMSALFEAKGGSIVLNSPVTAIHEESRLVRVTARDHEWRCGQLVVCAGLQADRVARLAGLDIDFQIVPFRGEYYTIASAKRDVVKHMIYPVPDPALPFLGVHLTPMTDGSLIAGPNAVLSLARENYSRYGFNLHDVMDYLRFPGFWKVVIKNLRSGMEEMYRTVWRRAYLESCRKYCPSLTLGDLQGYRSGIRAQAVERNGSLIHDFLFHQSSRMLHVCNAPSPAATSAIPIAKMIVDRLEKGGA